jgi:hypothetical protein
MKPLFLLLLALTSSINLYADCSWGGLYVYPQTDTINANSWIILEGYTYNKKILDSLNPGFDIYLEADGVKTPLTEKYRFQGDNELTQVVLIPNNNLEVGKIYYLKIINRTTEEEVIIDKWNEISNESEAIHWNIRPANDTTAPKMLKAPRLIDKSTIHYGCGPAVNAVFEISTKDQSLIFVKTQLVDTLTSKTSTYMLSLNNTLSRNKPDKLRVGHGMCSGNFRYKANGKYKVRFCLYDSSGNTTGEWSEWIAYDSPYEYYNFKKN